MLSLIHIFASGSSIEADTLETTWRTIMTGLDETKKIQESARTQRAQDQAKLEAIKKAFMSVSYTHLISIRRWRLRRSAMESMSCAKSRRACTPCRCGT